jgi:hypothetical protein
MKIKLAKHGGHVPLQRRAPQEINTADLPEATAQKLEGLVAAARSAGQPERGGVAPDGMSYVITVDDGTELRQSDARLTAEFSALLDFLDRQQKP